ncbi:unnamed protein product [Symbiodinium necroappetens]|uniref:Serine aminopeptidase S33 domain-containing protein n=1 Tax=Symbiodinium necroappetens TaxID=1628268 RepID=A0A812RBX9_9DINO|nr:unnamed protein product [Symbiodinium necroappetens]
MLSILDRLRRCGRAAPVGLSELEEQVVTNIWLGDYASALTVLQPVCEEQPWRALHAALTQLLTQLPSAERKSAAFVPRRLTEVAVRNSPSVGLGVQRVTGSLRVDGADLSYVLLLKDPAPVAPLRVLRFGGNAEVAGLSARSPEILRLVEQGLADVLLVDYRGFGWSTGVPSMATMRRDAEEVAAAFPLLLQQHGHSSEGPLVIVGRSIGSLAALHVALLGFGEALVLDSPVTCHWPLEGIPTATWASMGKAMPACLSAGGRLLGLVGLPGHAAPLH